MNLNKLTNLINNKDKFINIFSIGRKHMKIKNISLKKAHSDIYFVFKQFKQIPKYFRLTEENFI